MGFNSDVFFMVDYFDFIEYCEIVLLFNEGVGFLFVGDNVDCELVGYVIYCKIEFFGNWVMMIIW